MPTADLTAFLQANAALGNKVDPGEVPVTLTPAQVTAGAVGVAAVDSAGNILLPGGDQASGGGGSGATNLSWSPSPTGGVVQSNTGADATLTLADATNAGLMSPAQVVKLAGVAPNATANSADATLLARANHTGTQLASSISDFASAAAAAAPVQSVAGRTGAVTLGKADVGLAAVDNTADAAKPVSAPQAAAINAKYTLPAGGVPLTDLAAAVQLSLSLADSSAQYDSAFIEASQDVFGAMVASAGGTYNDATGTVTFPGGGGATAIGYTYVDLAAGGVSETTGDAYDLVNAAILAAHNGQGIRPDRVVFGPPGRYRIRRKLVFSDISVAASAPGCMFIVDDAQVTPTSAADFLVASTSGWPVSGTFRVRTIAGVYETITYTGVATGKFTGCTGGSGAAVEPGSLVTNDTQETTASIRSGAPTADVLSFSITPSSEVAVTSIGGRTQSVGVPELMVNSTSAFAASGSLTVVTRPAYPGGPAGSATCTYTGKTAYSFYGCVWTGSGFVDQGASVTDGTNTTQTYPTQTAYPWVTTRVRGSQAADSATLAVEDGLVLASSALLSSTYPASVRVRNTDGGWEVITYTGRTGLTLTGCTGGTAGKTLAANATVYADGPKDGAFKQGRGTRLYCTPTAAHVYGAMLKIGSNDILNKLAFNESGTDTVEVQGEFARILGVYDDCVLIDRELEFDYAKNPRMIVYPPGYWCELSDWHVSYIAPRPSETRVIAGWLGWLSVKGFDSPVVDNIGALHWPGPMFGHTNTLGARLGRFYPRWLLSSTLNGHIGYGVNSNASQDTTIGEIISIGCRHPWSTNAGDTSRAGDTSVENAGGVVRGHGGRLVAISPESFACDTHTDAVGFVWDSVTVIGDDKPRTEQGGALQNRGLRANGVRHLHYIGESGYAMLLQLGCSTFFADRVTGACQRLFGGGVTRRENATTWVTTSVTTATDSDFSLVVADASVLPAGPSWVLVPTQGNGTARITYTGVTSNTLTGCRADRVGSILGGTSSTGARVYRTPYADAWVRIGEIDVTCTGGTSLMVWEGGGSIDVGRMTVRYGPDTFRPQGALAHTMLSLAMGNDLPDESVVHIGELVIDLSAYRSAADIPVRLDMIGLDQRTAYRQFDLRRVTIDRLLVRYGNGMAGGPTSAKFSLFKGGSIALDGVHIGEYIEEQGGVVVDSFDPVFTRGALSSRLLVAGGARRGASGTVRPVGAQRTTLSSATSTLSHLGSVFDSTVVYGARDLVTSLTVSVGSAKITTLQAPSYAGQRWRIVVEPTSAYPAVIAAALVGAGADVSIAAGAEVTLVAEGSAWRVATTGVISSAGITDATTQGRAVLTAATAFAQKSAMGLPPMLGLPVAVASNTTLAANLHDGAVLHCTGTPTLTINTGLGVAFSADIRGAFGLAGTATVLDERVSGAVAPFCSLVPSSTLDAYVLIGSKT